MSDDNRSDGWRCYIAGDAEMRLWFERQWAIWPERAHPERTTNISFHRGAVEAYRDAHGHEPKLSRDFRGCVELLDRHPA